MKAVGIRFLIVPRRGFVVIHSCLPPVITMKSMGTPNVFSRTSTCLKTGQKVRIQARAIRLITVPLTFVYLNTESKVKKQTEWLKADLAATNQPWIIVALHHGPYGGNQNDALLDKWVPLFDEFGVDLVLQGHNHEYSRSYPLKGNQIVKDGDGTVYVVTNAAGSKFNKKKDDLYYHADHF